MRLDLQERFCALVTFDWLDIYYCAMLEMEI